MCSRGVPKPGGPTSLASWRLCSEAVIFFILFFFFFLAPHLLHMEVSTKSAYTTATAMSDLIRVYNLHLSSCQHWILNPLCEARDRTPILLDTSQGHYR